MAAIETDGLTKRFGDEVAVDDLDQCGNLSFRRKPWSSTRGRTRLLFSVRIRVDLHRRSSKDRSVPRGVGARSRPKTGTVRSCLPPQSGDSIHVCRLRIHFRSRWIDTHLPSVVVHADHPSHLACRPTHHRLPPIPRLRTGRINRDTDSKVVPRPAQRPTRIQDELFVDPRNH